MIPITTPSDLARRLAQVAAALRDTIHTMLTNQCSIPWWSSLMPTMHHTSIPPLTTDQVADTAAQIITYRLLTEYVTGEHLLGEDLPDSLAPSIAAIVSLLRHTNTTAMFEEIARTTWCSDPLTHFYETFLAAYNPHQRERRGVYYTPEPVVSYIIRSVDSLLHTHFTKPLGLADPRIVVVDPAVGTAAFLHRTLQQIRQNLLHQGDTALCLADVPGTSLPHLFGFDVMITPSIIACLKLERLLHAEAYPPQGRERLRISLANALKQAWWDTDTTMRAIRTSTGSPPVLVVVGNPPYTNYGMLNKGAWIHTLLDDYKRDMHEKKLNLDDDCIKFLRAGQWHIEQVGAGILAFITNHTYIDGITHRRMRQSLLETFNHIYILNLHGNAMKQERTPQGERDENIFDIRQGVAIGIFVKTPHARAAPQMYYADMWGSRQEKYTRLAESNVATTPWTTIEPRAGSFFFKPWHTTAASYTSWWSLRDIFGVWQNGIKTDRDSLFVDRDAAALEERIRTFYSDRGIQSPFQETYRVENSSSYHILARRAKTTFDPRNIHRCLYRPFDVRWMYYAVGLTSRPAWKVMRHMVDDRNIALIGMRQYEYPVQSYCYVSVTEHLCESRICISNRGCATIFPLYLFTPSGRRSNLLPSFLAEVQHHTGLRCVPEGHGNLTTTIGTEDMFHYLYALLHTPTYRLRYADLLKIDFPRVPILRDLSLWAAAIAAGAHLVDLHLLRLPGGGRVGGMGGSPLLENPAPQHMLHHLHPPSPMEHPCSVPPQEGKARQLTIGNAQALVGIELETWQHEVGGYRPLAKWLLDRKGHHLGPDDTQHYLRMIIALRETRRIMDDLDRLLSPSIEPSVHK